MPVIGQAELTRRIVALGLTRQAIADAWSAEAVRLMRERVRVRSGATRASIHVAAKSEKGARIVSTGASVYLEKGTPPHPIPGGKAGRPLKGKAMKFQYRGRTVFAKQVDHPRSRKHTFARVSANAAKRNLKKEISRLWDAAA
jgi:hypothetical protein